MKLTQIENKIIEQKNGGTKEIKIVKEIDYKITGYEFPNEKSLTAEFNYDANWLTDKITFQGKHYSTAGILNTELATFVENLEKITQGETDFCELEPIEVGLQMSVKRINLEYLFTISFGITAEEMKKQTVSQLLGKKELIEKIEELKMYLDRFPER